MANVVKELHSLGKRMDKMSDTQVANSVLRISAKYGMSISEIEWTMDRMHKKGLL